MELENTLMLSTRVYTKGSGTRVRWKDGDTMNIKILFSKDSFFKTLSMASELSTSLRETNISASMLLISFMAKESMSGPMVLPTSATLGMLKDMILAFGFPQDQSQRFTKVFTPKTKSKEVENMFGLTGASTKATLTMT